MQAGAPVGKRPNLWKLCRFKPRRATREFAGAIERSLNVGQCVIAADKVREAALGKQARGLLHRSAQQQGASGTAEAQRKALDGVDPRGIDCRHHPPPQDHDGRKCLDVICRLDQLLRGPEEKPLVNAQQRKEM